VKWPSNFYISASYIDRGIGQSLYSMIYSLIYSCEFMPKGMPKKFKGFRFNAKLYDEFKTLATKNGYTVTETFEKFMSSSIEFGISFPSPLLVENVESEARIMLAWLKGGRYWVNLGGGVETSTRGRLLLLLPAVENTDLKKEIEETLKNKP
jgi:hypothetical protein